MRRYRYIIKKKENSIELNTLLSVVTVVLLLTDKITIKPKGRKRRHFEEEEEI